jgi:hypothetical protein
MARLRLRSTKTAGDDDLFLRMPDTEASSRAAANSDRDRWNFRGSGRSFCRLGRGDSVLRFAIVEVGASR